LPQPFEAAFEILDPDGVQVGVVRPPVGPLRRVWVHGVLFLATLATTTLVGGLSFAELPPEAATLGLLRVLVHPALLKAGLQFSLPLMTILLAHEMGHFIACRRHRLDATLPFFLPVPFGIGTFGAFIKIRTPLANKRELFDVGASGPIAGFIAAVPILIAGIALSHSTTVTPPPGSMLFGEPLAFQIVARAIHGALPAGADLLLHPTGFAAWFGLLVTALNLLPFGQLDGGHVVYALFGRWQRRVAWPLLGVLVALGFRWTGWWIWAVIALVMGPRHPWIPGEEEPLDRRRLILGIACIILFVLCLTPEPVRLLD